MAGANAGFPAGRFRDAIRFVYNMASPVDPAEQLSFHWKPITTTGPGLDSEGVPFDIAGPRATVVQPDPVIVPAGIEQVPAGERSDVDTPFGVLRSPWVKIYLLDEEYALVHNADWILLGKERYTYHHTEVPTGLFQVGMYVMIFVNENDL